MPTERKEKSKIRPEAFRRALLDYQQKNERFKELKKQIEEYKKDFYEMANSFFKENDSKSFTVIDDELDANVVKLTMVENVKVEFDAEKLEKKLGKKISHSVITKKAIIYDIDGFISYMKEIGASPKKVKSFLEIQREVDKSKIENMSEVGDIKLSDIKGCYSVKKGNPYYRLTKGKDNGK